MSVATFLAILCAGSCYENGSVVQVSVPPEMVSYTRPSELLPKATIDNRLYVLVPEIRL
jgi:hypothetical protein